MKLVRLTVTGEVRDALGPLRADVAKARTSTRDAARFSVLVVGVAGESGPRK